MFKREGWPVNAKRVYRIYREEGLMVRTQKRKEGGVGSGAAGGGDAAQSALSPAENLIRSDAMRPCDYRDRCARLE